MDRVGDELVAIALRRPSAEDIDLFGRSAINRYYYACFLTARGAILRIAPPKTIRHKELPIYIRATIADKVRREISRLHGLSAISLSEAHSYRVTLNGAIQTLADTLETAYNLRVVADYEPSKLTTKTGGILQLDGKSSTQARDWTRQVTQNSARILRLWRDLGQY